MRNRPRALCAHVRHGFSLVEIAMVLAVAALMIAGVMLFFGRASEAQKTEDMFAELTVIQQTMRSVYGGQPSYAGLTDAVLVASGQMPSKWVRGTLVVSPFGAVTVVADPSNSATYDIGVYGVPGDACQKFVTSDYGPTLVKLTLGTQSTIGASASIAAAQIACPTGTSNAFSWTFM